MGNGPPVSGRQIISHGLQENTRQLYLFSSYFFTLSENLIWFTTTQANCHPIFHFSTTAKNIISYFSVHFYPFSVHTATKISNNKFNLTNEAFIISNGFQNIKEILYSWTFLTFKKIYISSTLGFSLFHHQRKKKRQRTKDNVFCRLVEKASFWGPNGFDVSMDWFFQVCVSEHGDFPENMIRDDKLRSVNSLPQTKFFSLMLTSFYFPIDQVWRTYFYTLNCFAYSL